MERMLVVIFDSEAKAYEATHALGDLDREGSISIHAESVIQKNADGGISIKKSEEDFPVRALAGTAIGGLIGLLGGPVGLGIGAATGALVGMFGDLYVADVNVDFLKEVSDALKPGKFAVLADMSEEWITPVDVRMEALGGVVHRTLREYAEEEYHAKDLAALKAEIDHLKAEHSRAQAERKAKIQAQIDALNRKLETKIEQAKKRSEQIKHETDAKVKALQQRAAKAQGGAKAAIEARITEIKKHYEQSDAKLRNAIAEHLRKTAERLQKAG